MKSIINKKDKYSDIKKFNPASIFLTLFELIQLKFVKMFDYQFDLHCLNLPSIL